jgi:hypothetical protein
MILRPLAKPVTTLAISPTGDSLLAMHGRTDGPNTDPAFAGSPALSVISLRDWRSNPVRLENEPSGYAHSSGGTWGFVILEDRKEFLQVDYGSLLTDVIDLKSVPAYVGVLPDLDATDGDEPPAWASQEHELGRISFYDPDDASLETITGFELNSHIEE